MMTEMFPRRDADGDGDGSTLWLYLPLAPCAGVASQSWHPVPSCLTLWVMCPPRHGLPWLWVVSRCAYSHPVSGVWPRARAFCVCGGWRQYEPPARPTSPSEGDCAPSGSSGSELPFLGSGEVRPVPKGSGERNLRPRGRANRDKSWGSDETAVTPFNCLFDFDRWSPLVPLLWVP
jgi:hypothetical protein